jgi:hypothetical protein
MASEKGIATAKRPRQAPDVVAPTTRVNLARSPPRGAAADCPSSPCRTGHGTPRDWIGREPAIPPHLMLKARPGVTHATAVLASRDRR